MDSSIGTKSASARAHLSAAVTMAPTKVIQLLDFASMLGNTKRSAASLEQLSGDWNPAISEPSWRDDRSGSNLQSSKNNSEPSYQTSTQQNRDSRETGDAVDDADSPRETPDLPTPPALPVSETPIESKDVDSKDVVDKDSSQNAPELGVVPSNDRSKEPKGMLAQMADQENPAQPELAAQPTRLAADSSTGDLASMDDPQAAGDAMLETTRTPNSPADQQPTKPTEFPVAGAGQTSSEITSPGNSETSTDVAINAEENLASDAWNSAAKAIQALDSAVPKDSDPKDTRDSRITNQRRQRLARWFERSQPSPLNQDLDNSGSPSDSQTSSLVRQKANETTAKDAPSAAWQASHLHATSNATHEKSTKTDLALTGQSDGNPKILASEALAHSVSVFSKIASSLADNHQSIDTAAWGSSAAQHADTASLGSGDSRSNERPAVTSVPGQNANTLHPNAATPVAESNPNLQAAERVRLIQRVARSFQRLGAEGGMVQLRLHPPELGSLSMQVRIDGRNLVAKLTTESAAAREVIMESLPQLRSRLVEQGFEVMQINVEVADQNGFGSPGESPGQSSFGSPNGQSSEGYSHGALDLRRSAHLRRQLETAGLPANSTSISIPAGVGLNSRGIDLHA